MISSPHIGVAPVEFAAIFERKMKEFLRVMRRFETLTWDDVTDIVTSGVWDAKEKDALLGLCAEHRNNGNLPASVKNLDIRLRAAIAPSFRLASGIGGIGSMVFDSEYEYDSYHVYNQDMISDAFSEGTFARLSGPPRQGKTNFACVLMEHYSKKGEIFTNIFMEKPVRGIKHVNGMRELLTAICNTKHRFLFILDEGVVSGYGKPDATTKHQRHIDKFLRLIGKLRGNVLYIDQREMSAPNVVMEWSRLWFRAIKPGTMYIQLDDYFKKTVKDFPETHLPYRTRDLPSFEVDVDMEKLFPLLGGSDEPTKTILEFIKS